MPESKEVFEMVTQKTGPDQGALQRQHEAQERRRRRQRIGAIALAAAVIAALAIFFITNPAGDTDGLPASRVSTSPPPTSLPGVATMSPAFVDLHGTVISGVNLPPDAWEPNLSRDGRWIVYVTASPDVAACSSCAPGARIVAARIDGSGARYLTQYGGPGISGVDQPVWSPDGTRIAFVARGASDHGPFTANIFVIGADGSGMEQLTTGPTQKGWPSWSPDGRNIVYNDAGKDPLDDSGFSTTQEIYSVGADGAGGPIRITDNHVDDSEAVYSPDGSRIALLHAGNVAIMDADGSHVHSVAEGFSPRWSPDGSSIALLVYNGVERFQLADPETGGSSWPRLDVKVLSGASGKVKDLGVSVASDVNAVSWSPNGKSVFVNRTSNPSG
jgi:Tol biopolymer transport system component